MTCKLVAESVLNLRGIGGHVMKLKSTLIGLIALGALTFGVQSRAEWQPDPNNPDELNAAEAVATFKQKDPGLKRFFENAHGYAVFPSVGKGGFGIGGAHGKGIVFEQGSPIGRSTLSQVTIGLQMGGQVYSEIIFFKDKTALEDFKRGNYEMGAQASAVAATLGASADTSYNGGVAVFTIAKGGLMYEASVGGQKFSYKPYK
jgi:lipid-binding SYLF domain-containing protein